jgi:ACR3 family arsenite efflux pump ArsB
VTELFPRPKNPPTVFGGLVLIGAVIAIGAVPIYVFGSHADSTLTIILVAIGLILIVLAIPVYKWERDHIRVGRKFNRRLYSTTFFRQLLRKGD